MLQVKNLNKSFGSKQVLFDINFKADNGKILGLIGKNGSGKTTLFHSILKFVKYQGKITIDNHSFSSRDYNSVGYLPEERSLMPKLTVLDQVSFLASLKGMKKDTVKHDLQDWMQKLEVKGKTTDKIKSLSKGNQQKIQLIATLIHQPNLIILDEPFSGLDPVNVEIIKNVILQEKRRGATIIFSDHDMSNVEELCDDVCILDKGQLVVSGDINHVRASNGNKKVVIESETTIPDLTNIRGIIHSENMKQGLQLTIENEDVAKDIYQVVAHQGYVKRFQVVEPSLQDIFIEKVGGKDA